MYLKSGYTLYIFNIWFDIKKLTMVDILYKQTKPNQTKSYISNTYVCKVRGINKLLPSRLGL